MAAPKEGGFKMSLGGLKGKVGLKASSIQKEAKRPRLALGDEDEDDSNKQQEISGWDAEREGTTSGYTSAAKPRLAGGCAAQKACKSTPYPGAE
jgi:hypothetical protein